MEFFFQDCPDTLTMIDYINEKRGFSIKDNLTNFKFTEFTLKELGLPLADELLQSTLNVENHIGGVESWREKNKNSLNYKGFSLSYNKNFIDTERSVFYQTLGAYELPQSYSKDLSAANFKQQKNSYYDSYSFNSIQPIIAKSYDNLFQKINFSIARSRAVYFYSGEYSTSEYMPYHKDEYPFQLLRLNIPLTTWPEYKLEIKGEDEFGNYENIVTHLEVGKAYLWNTRIPHRVYCEKNFHSPVCRIHLVLGLIPWYDLQIDENKAISLKSNSYYGQNIKSIVDHRLFVKKH